MQKIIPAPLKKVMKSEWSHRRGGLKSSVPTVAKRR